MALTACASQSASRAELDEVRNELRLVRGRADRLEKRMERIEVERSVEQAASRRREPAAQARRAPRSISASDPDAGTTDDEGDAPGELMVIKLKPKAAGSQAPKLATRVSVVEPDPATAARLLTPVSSGDEDTSRRKRAVAAEDELEYDTALGELRGGNAESGIARLRAFAARNPGHALADNALYFSGVGLMGLGEYQDAADAFLGVVDGHPSSDVVAQALLRLAECQTRLSRHDRAKDAYRRVVKSFPGTDAAAQAEQRLASLSRTK